MTGAGLIEIVWSLVFLAGALLLIRKWRFFRVEGLSTRTISGIFLLKILAGIAVWAIYTWHYEYRAASDAYGYFDDAMILNSYLLEQPSIWFRFMFGINLHAEDLKPVFERMVRWTSSYTYGIANDNPTVIRLNMIIGLFSFGAYHVHTVAHAFLSLMGLTWLTRMLKDVRKGSSSTIIFLSLSLFPSVLFWSSGVLKEAVLLFVFGGIFYGTKAWFYPGYRNKLWLILFTLLGFYIKPYVVISLLPALLAYMIVKQSNWKPLIVFPAVLLASYVLASSAHLFFPAGNLQYILSKKQTDFYNVAAMNDAGSVVDISPVQESSLGFLLDAPERIWLACFRPLPPDYEGLFYLVPVGESLLALGLSLLMLIVLVKGRLSIGSYELRTPESSFTWLVVSFVLTLAVIIGSCVPVLGAIVRYKIPFLLLLGGWIGGSISALARKEQFKSGK
ncbi:hypothetical protein [Sanyastnella coralliicola]|uniref:hypothetical protein n=1 Tax=Sanyastnella coralliicola TaxID=3069118 RepID=UPI0027BA6C38|nr:hypothetical protein [Longitalea sp. SCSIO 12813]